MFTSIETPMQQWPQTTPIETAESTLPSDETPLPPESITTPMLNNLQRFTNENALLKEGIKNLAAETEEAETEEAETEEADNEEAEIEEAEIEEAEIEEAETEEAETEEVTFFIKEQPFLLKKVKVMKRNTAVKTWNYYNFYVSKTLLYLKKMRLKMK